MSGFEAGSIYYTIEAKTGALLIADKQVQNFNNNAQDGFDKTDGKVNSLNSSLGKLTQIAKAVTAALVTNQIFAYASAWNDLEDRLKNTGLAAYELKNVQDQLMTTSNRNGRTIEESAELYIRLSNSMAEMGYSTQSTLSYIDSLSNLMTINKTSALGAESAINALTKAQMKGKLSGQESLSVFNAMPSVLKTLGAQLKKTEIEVKQMATDGKLSMSDFQNAIISAQPELAKLADNMRNNLGDATNHFTNELKKALGEMNNSTGAIQYLVDGIKLLADNMGTLITAAEMLAAVMAGRYVSSMLSAAKTKAALTVETYNKSKATQAEAAQELKNIAVQKSAIDADIKALTVKKQLAAGTSSSIAIEKALAAAQAQRITLTNAEAAAQARLSTVIKASTIAANGLKSAMALLGGPAGILMMAVGALASFVMSADNARESVVDLKQSVSELTEEYKKLDEASKEAFKSDTTKESKEGVKELDNAVDALKAKFEFMSETQYDGIGGSFRYLSEEAKKYVSTFNSSIDSLSEQLKKGSISSEDYSAQMTKLWKSQSEHLNLTETQYNAFVDVGKSAVDAAVKISTANGVIQKISESTEELTSSTKKLNNEFNETTKTNIEKKISDLSTQLEIAELKQKGLTKEAYVYQSALSALGDEAGKYQVALKGLITGSADMSDLTDAEVKALQPLIDSLGKLFDANEGKSNKSSEKMKELKDNIAVTKLELAGYLEKAKELKALQEAKATGGTAEEIVKVQALTLEYQKMQEAKLGQSFAQEQINNGLTEAQKIDLEQKDKLERLNEWRATGLADEQLYQDSLTAITDDANKKRKKIDDDAAAAKLANAQALLSSSADMFGGMADLIGAFSNESGAAYKSMFAISKGFAIANATLSVASAAIKALDDPLAVTPAQKFANYAAVAAAGGSLVSQLSSISYGGGRLTGGSVDASKMYRVNESGQPEMYVSNGKQYMLPNRNGEVVPSNKLGGGSAPVINWSINVINNTDSSVEQSVNPDSKQIDIIVNKAVNKIDNSIRNHTGSTWQAMQSSTNIKAKLG